MASEAKVNGGSSADLTPAQKLMEKHTTDDGHSHNVTIEDTIDEEDIAHPPPSGLPHTAEASTEQAPEPMSEKLAGKQPEAAPAPTPKPAKERLDTQSEELFPSLGAPKSRPSAAAPTPWSRKPAAVANTNGVVNGNVPSASRSSGPSSATMTPPSSGPSLRGGAQPQMSLPGRHTERIALAPSQLTPRSQLKKPVNDVIRDINKRSKADVKISTGPGGSVIFEGTGPTDAVRQALKEIVRELGSKQSVRVPVPLSVRAHIIGRQGANIQAMSKRTGARIQIPKQEQGEAVAEDDDSATVDVLIEGDAVSAEMARREIEALVNERTSSVNMRLKDIPAEYYPFLAGPHNSRMSAFQGNGDLKVQIPHYHTWVDQAPPQAPANRAPASFLPQASLPISISGDRQAAAEARAAIERQVEELQRQLTMEQMAIERGRHQFIVGDKGTSLHDFLAETGCAVIIPPDAEDSEMLTIVGPAERIDEGMNKIMDLASSMTMANVDIARQHPNAPSGAQAHARNVTRYLQQRQAMEELERLYDARIVAQTAANAPTAWEVYSREGKNAMRARSDIMNLISAHPPSRFAPMSVDPFFHEHLQQRAAEQIREQYGVHVIVPDESEEEPEIILVYEGPGPVSDYQLPRRQPSSTEAQQFAQALQQAQEHLLGLTAGHENIILRDVDAAPKFHDKIRRHVDRQRQGLPAGQIPVQVRVGASKGPSAKKGAAPQVSMRGPSDAVDALVENLLAFIAQEEQDELERGFTLSFDFPQKFANQLIGKSGANIRKLRDEFDVDIQVNDGKVELKGPEAKANACKAHIISLGKKLEDEATHVLKVKPQFHRELIGKQGAQVNRLQERYNVRINFPRSAAGADDDTPGGEETARRSNQQADEVIIRGPKRGADEARDELLSLLQYTMDTSHSATVSVAQAQLPSLIGSGGKELESLRLATGASIDVPNAREAADPSGRAEVKIKGTKKAVEDAKKMIQDAAKTFDATVTRSIDVDRKHHRTIIGAGGSNLRNIVIQAGGPDDKQKQARMVRFPRADADGNAIRVEGTQEVVDKIIAQIEAMASERDNQTTEIIDVAPEKHRLLIGRGGDIRRNLESQFKVQIDIPRQSVTGAARSQVKVAGKPADVAQAKEHIASLVKDQEGQTVQVPIKYHNIIADNGQFFRRLRNDHRVTVDHAGQRPPSKNSAPTPKRGGALPLITDDAGADPENFSWELHELHADAPEGDIPWTLSGPSSEDIDKARARLEAALTEASKHDSTGFLILPDPRAYRLVIGPGGSEINRIRKQTGCKVNVPKQGESGSEAIEITGTKQGCEDAKDIIVGIVQQGGA